MKRIIAFVLALSLFVAHSIPLSVAAVDSAEVSVNNILKVEYMDFYTNQEYYESLAINGYTVIINVGEKYKNLEKNRIANKCMAAQKTADIAQPYGNSEPTQKWNCYTQNSCPVSGHNYNTTIYSNYKVYGALSFIVSITNLYESITMTYIPHGNSDSVTSVTVPPSSTVLRGFAVPTTESYFYLSFPPPAYFEGYIDTIAV